MPTDFKGISTTRGREYWAGNMSYINEKLKEGEIPVEQRAAILGSIIEESGGNPYAKNNSGAYQGLLQWGADRYRPKSTNPRVELNNQAQYILDTMDNTSDGVSWTHGGKGSGYNTQKETHNAFYSEDNTFADKFRAFSYGYVRPKGKEDSYNNRLKVGRKVLNRLVVDENLARPKPKELPLQEFGKNSFASKFKFAEGGDLEDNYWNNLSMKDKAEMMKVAIANGITSLPEIRLAYNEFAKGGRMNGWTMQDEAGYRAWRQNLPRNLRNTNDNDYDMRAAYKAGMEPQWNEEDKSYHLRSRDPESGRILKSPHHPTFLKALIEDASMGYYPTMDSNGKVYTETWEGNKHADGGNLYREGGRKGGAVNTNSQKAMTYLLSKGMSRTGAAAIVGTLQAESGLDPTVHARMKGDSGEGLAQWTGSRKKNFWKTLEAIEPGAQKRYGSIDRVPLERQLDVVLAERPSVTNAIHSAKDISTATDIMLRGYENGGGTIGTIASKGQMDKIYGKWNNGYNNQMKRRLGNASNLLGTHFDPASYELPKEFFDDISSQIADIPQLQLPEDTETDPELRYKAPTIDMTLFQQPEETKAMESIYNPQQERLEGLRSFNTVLGLMGQQSPFAALGSSNTGLLDYIGQIYS